jgi:outer membrane protein TolC
LFKGGRDKSRLSQARTDLLTLETRYDETEKQFRLQVIQAENELNTARSQLQSATANVKNYEEYYRETKLRYAQGLVIIVELDDAFTHLINGRIAQQLSQANVQIKLAELEYAAGTYSL